MLNVSKPISFMRATARRSTCRGSPSYGSPFGVTTSQIIRATFERSPSEYGISWNVVGSGIATMSDSSIALKPVIDEPSKPMPSSSAPSSSAGVIAKLFRCPSMSVNQRRTKSHLLVLDPLEHVGAQRRIARCPVHRLHHQVLLK